MSATEGPAALRWPPSGDKFRLLLTILLALAALYGIADLAVAAARGWPDGFGDSFALWSWGRFAAEHNAAAIYDPENMVMGGGFAGSFDLFDHEIKLAMSALPDSPSVTPSVIASEAVLIGGLIAADPFVEKWLAKQVSVL